MAAIKDLLIQITDATLRSRLETEFKRMNKNKKFGLVFEEHIPECTPLYGVPVKKGNSVAIKTGQVNDVYSIIKIDGDKALCANQVTGITFELPLDSLVTVARFGEPIFPTLEHIADVENAPGSNLWHTIIEADNYHALQLLEYLYPRQVDCIYIDPPYNTGAKDWKYNNDYVDSADAWRHSKWLSMMKKRLLLAKRILNPETGVLIVTIDEHEVHHLRTILEEIFPEFFIQMVTVVTNPKGVTQGRFSRVEEYVVFCFAKNAFVADSNDNLLNIPDPNRKPRWKGLLRSGTDALRADRESMFYPVYIDADRQMAVSAGQYMPISKNPILGEKIDGYDIAWPIRRDGSYGRWSVGSDTLNELIKKGYVACGKFDIKRNTWGISYISQPNQLQIERGGIRIVARDPITDVVEIEYANDDTRVIKTVWHRTLHDAGAYGSDMVTTIVGQSRAFSFPKALYSTKDAIAAVVRNKPDALIVDFFAGSGTTLNAVNLINAEDGGKRRCILVTNNEVSVDDAERLKRSGLQPGDPEWETHGICRAVTWSRTRNSILGKRADGTPLVGEYFTNQTAVKDIPRSFKQLRFDGTSLSIKTKKDLLALIGKLPQNLVKQNSAFVISEKHTISILFDITKADEWLTALEDQEHITEFYIVTTETKLFTAIKEKVVDLLGGVTVTEQIKRPMKDGFTANAEYFKLGFLDKSKVSLGRQFREILPLLWLKAGAVEKRPLIDGDDEPDMLILPNNKFAVLNNEDMYVEFVRQLKKKDGVDIVYFVTNSEASFREMSDGIKARQTYQLYRDYIDNFVLGARREQ